MKILQRNEIDNKYKWDLSPLCASNEEFDLKVKELMAIVPEMEQYQGKLGDKEQLLECLKSNSALIEKIVKLYAYAMQKSDENTMDTGSQSNQDKASNLYSKFAVAVSYIEPELAELDSSYIEEVIADERFADYDVSLKETLRLRSHTLSQKEEIILANGGEMFGGFKDIFNVLNNADLKFGELEDENGNMMELSHSKYGYFMSSDDREVRKKAYTMMYGEYKKLLHTISATYIGNCKKDVFLAKVRGFESCLEYSMFYENADPVVYENLLENVEKALPTMHDYIDLRAKVMGLDDIGFYDLNVALVENKSLKLEFDDAYELVKKALVPLGADYIDMLTNAKESGWIDVYNNVGKRSGAYSNSSYGCHPYVLLNYEKTVHDVFTIAHEMGHAMHSYYSNNAQPFEKADYTIFVAEVASTVNEVLLLRYLIDNTEDKEMKKFCLNYFLDMFRTTLFRQTMFAEFEYNAHCMLEADMPLTKDVLSGQYEELNRKYYGERILHDDCIKHEWARIPHFYRSFYVYKYSTGIISAISIAYDILKNGEEVVAKYKKFLQSGCTDSPVELLKIAGIDLTTAVPFENAMNVFESTLKELKELYND